MRVSKGWAILATAGLVAGCGGTAHHTDRPTGPQVVHAMTARYERMATLADKARVKVVNGNYLSACANELVQLKTLTRQQRQDATRLRSLRVPADMQAAAAQLVMGVDDTEQMVGELDSDCR